MLFKLALLAANAVVVVEAGSNEAGYSDNAYINSRVSGGPCVGNVSPIEGINFPGLCLSGWDIDLANKRGLYMGEEFRAKGVNVLLGYEYLQITLYLIMDAYQKQRPVVGPLGRNPLDGRVWEGFGPDPFLSGAMGFNTIDGIQKSGTQACVKHLIVNEQETQRTASTVENVTIKAVSSNVDDRTMHEAYLWPFAEAVKAGVASVMCSYNRINETYACENDKVQNGLLKGELGFQGYLMSDWGADMSSTPSVMGGLDMDMPGPLSWPYASNGSVFTAPSYYGSTLVELARNGTVPLWRIDDMVLRVLTPWYFIGQDRDDYPTIDPSNSVIFPGYGGTQSQSSNITWRKGLPSNRDVRGNHAILIRDLASSAATLLKNDNGVLPYRVPPRGFAVFGGDAGNPSNGPDSTDSAWGTFTGGNLGRPSYLLTPLEAMEQWAYEHRSVVQWDLDTATIVESGYSVDSVPALEACFVFINAISGEASDRTSLDFSYNGTALVEKVAASCNNTIVITHSVGPNVYDFADNENVTAIIAAHLPSTEAGSSIVDVISGAVSPSGRLPYTIPYKESDSTFAAIANFTGSTNPNAWQSNFTEGLFLDYRHFDKYDITPRYEFGYGMSYTSFEISKLSSQVVSKKTPAHPPKASTQPGGNPNLYKEVASFTFSVKNTGHVDGTTVAQLYLSLPDTAPQGTPLQVLRGFKKIALKADQEKRVTIDLDRKSMSYWDVLSQDWQIPSGEFTVKVGFSSRDHRVSTKLALL
ncbi:beta-glucosidase G [Penicillium herquei]|nr:beta-glucosidase G [Penicillium herquei]